MKNKNYDCVELSGGDFVQTRDVQLTVNFFVAPTYISKPSITYEENKMEVPIT